MSHGLAMRILLASDHYPPFIGGAHVQTEALAHGLLKRGHDVAVATPWQQGLPSRCVEDGVEVNRIRQIRTLVSAAVPLGQQQHQPPFADPVTVVGLRRLMHRFRPQVVHSHGWFSYSCVAALAGTEARLLLSARDYGYGCPKRTLLHGDEICSGPGPLKCGACAGAHFGRPKGWVATAGVLGSRPLLRRRIAGIHSVSTFVRDQVRRDFLHIASPDLIEATIPEAVPGAVKGPPSPAVQADLRKLPDGPFILFVGALRTIKGVPALVEAYGSLPDPPPLVLIGTHEADSPRVYPEGVVVLNDLHNDAILRAWDRAIFGVFPSLWPEPLGTVVCEAMSRGKAVIGTRPGGHEDSIQHEVSGLLVPRGDVVSLAAAMQRLLDDPALRERLGRGAAERATAFAVDTVIGRFESLYHQVVANGGPAR
jgi:glycosyltransferase involved in cell wall biosynthesis